MLPRCPWVTRAPLGSIGAGRARPVGGRAEFGGRQPRWEGDKTVVTPEARTVLEQGGHNPGHTLWQRRKEVP